MARVAPRSRFVSHEERVRWAAEGRPGASDLQIVREVRFIAGTVQSGGRIQPLREIGPWLLWMGVPGATRLGVTCPEAPAPPPAGGAGLATGSPTRTLGWNLLGVAATLAVIVGGRWSGKRGAH